MYFSQANFTLELRFLINDPNFKIFDFDYSLNEDLKNDFENRFKEYYYDYEIGFETVQRFKHHLMSRLRLKSPYYNQIYETELKSKNIEFLLNKDLKESYTRTVDDTNNSKTDNTGNSTSTDISSTNSTTDSTNDSNYKESNINNGNSDVNLGSGYLTGVSNTKDTTTGNETSSYNGTNTSNNTSNSVVDSVGKTVESYDLISQGNIGTTSSAELLSKWREVLINLIEQIILDCRDLFMMVY